jgi:hypothetical protein
MAKGYAHLDIPRETKNRRLVLLFIYLGLFTDCPILQHCAEWLTEQLRTQKNMQRSGSWPTAQPFRFCLGGLSKTTR